MKRADSNTSNQIKYVVKYFLVTRVFLEAIGVLSRIWLHPFSGAWRDQWAYHKSPLLNLWGIWDTGWYLDIAKGGYSTILLSDLPKRTCCNQANINFFPLYPILIKLLGLLTQNNFVAGLIISNVALLVSGVFLYKMVILLKKDDSLAKRSVKYLFLFPTAFLLSAVFSESLFLMLLILVFYFALRKKWFLACVAGGLLALTRHVGLIILVPLLLEYLKTRKYTLPKVRMDVLFLLLVPVGTFVYMFYLYLLTGDWLAFVNIHRSAWGAELSNPLILLWNAISSHNGTYEINALFAIVLLAVAAFSKKYLSLSLYVLSIMYLVTGLIAGRETFQGFMRFSTVVFPLFIVFGCLASNKVKEYTISSIFIVFQIIFMVYWSNGLLII